MTTAQYHCPLCASMFQCDASLAGSQVACPTCNGLVTLPEADNAGQAYSPQAVPSAEPLQLGCPVCSGLFQVTTDLQGTQVICPHCGNMVAIPTASELAAAGHSEAGSPQPKTNEGRPSPPPERQEKKTPSDVQRKKTHSDRAAADERRKPSPTPKPGDKDSAKRRLANGGKRPDSPSAIGQAGKGSPEKEAKVDPNVLPPARKESSSRAPDGESLRKPHSQEGSGIGKDASREKSIREKPRPAQPGPHDSNIATSQQRDRDSGASAPDKAPRPEKPTPQPQSEKPAAEPKDSPKPAAALLPPSINAEFGVPPGERVALPGANGQPRSGIQAPATRAGEVIIPTENGFTTVRQPGQKKIMTSEGELELRRLSPEEKIQRRRRRNMILWTVCALLMLITIALLLYLGPL